MIDLHEGDTTGEGYVVVVPAGETELFDYLEHTFKADPAVAVVLDRRAARRPEVPATASVLFHGVTVVRLAMAAPLPRGASPTTDHTEGDRTMEGPELERIRARLASAEAENDRLRQDVEALRREVAALQNEVACRRQEQTAAAARVIG